MQIIAETTKTIVVKPIRPPRVVLSNKHKTHMALGVWIIQKMNDENMIKSEKMKSAFEMLGIFDTIENQKSLFEKCDVEIERIIQQNKPKPKPKPSKKEKTKPEKTKPNNVAATPPSNLEAATPPSNVEAEVVAPIPPTISDEKTKQELYWENLYNEKYVNNKYKKNSKNFNATIHGNPVEKPNIYIIPRERGGPSYKLVELEHDDVKNIQFCPISKGFSMQDVSSFTMGPIINHGLNLVNSAFSKCIAIKHIDGSGCFSMTNQKFWKKNRKGPQRKITCSSNETSMCVDGVIVNKEEWLKTNQHLWFNDWKKWHDTIRFSANGHFNRCDDSTIIAYCNIIDNPDVPIYLDFISWKKTCYIAPAYELLNKKDNKVMVFLKHVFQEKKVSLGLVHPMGKCGEKERAITSEYITHLYNATDCMACMPYVVAGFLLGVSIN